MNREDEADKDHAGSAATEGEPVMLVDALIAEIQMEDQAVTSGAEGDEDYLAVWLTAVGSAEPTVLEEVDFILSAAEPLPGSALERMIAGADRALALRRARAVPAQQTVDALLAGLADVAAAEEAIAFSAAMRSISDDQSSPFDYGAEKFAEWINRLYLDPSEVLSVIEPATARTDAESVGPRELALLGSSDSKMDRFRDEVYTKLAELQGEASPAQY